MTEIITVPVNEDFKSSGAKLVKELTRCGFTAVIAHSFVKSLGSIQNANCRWTASGFLYGFRQLHEYPPFWIILVGLALFGLHRMATGGIGNISACLAKLSWDFARLQGTIYTSLFITCG